MPDIVILNNMPIVFTKDKSYADRINPVKNGSIVFLPDDAILVDVDLTKDSEDA